VDVVHRASGDVWPGPEFPDVHRNKAYFHWLGAGCGELFTAMPAIVRNGNRVGEFYRRDPSAIAHACREINTHAFDPTFHRVLDALDDRITRVADLGCGSGARLAQLAERWKGVRGVGIDVSATALIRADEHLGSVGLGGRFDLVEGDVRAMEFDSRFTGIEVVTCFMMGHDLWPLANCRESLRRLRAAFPNARRFLLGDTARTAGVPDREKSVFTLGFETAHDLMGVYLPTLDEWAEAFVGSGWQLVRAHPVTSPADSVIFELA
jgi:SAM-dependent methyltransferase